MKRTGYTLLTAIYLISLFANSVVIRYLLGLAVLFCILVSIRGSARLHRIVSLLFLGASLILFAMTGLSPAMLPLYVQSTVPVVALLFMLPFINGIFRAGRYDRKLRSLLSRRMSHYGQLYWRSLFVSYLMSLFLFFGALPVVFDVIRKKVSRLPDHVRKTIVSKSLLRGFAIAEVWSPMEILVVVTIDYTRVDYLSLLPLLFLLSCFYFVVDVRRGWRFKTYALPDQPETGEGNPQANPGAIRPENGVGKSIAVLGAALVVLIGLSLTLHYRLNIGFLSALTLTILPYALIWSLLIGRFRVYTRYSLLIWRKRTDGLQNMMLLFLSLGFFNSMASESGFLELLRQPFTAMGDFPPLLFAVIPACVLGLSFVGFHPLVTVSLLCMAVQPLLAEIPPAALAVSLITAGLSTAAAGSYNTSVNVTADLLQVNPYRISAWNLRFSLYFAGIGGLTAWLMTLLAR